MKKNYKPFISHSLRFSCMKINLQKKGGLLAMVGTNSEIRILPNILNYQNPDRNKITNIEEEFYRDT